MTQPSPTRAFLDQLGTELEQMTVGEAALATDFLVRVDVELPPATPQRVRALVWWLHAATHAHAIRTAHLMRDMGVQPDLDISASPTIADARTRPEAP